MTEITHHTAEEQIPKRADKRTIWQAAKVYLQPETLRMVFLGFAAGLPLMLVLVGIGFWLAEAGISKKTIGYLSWAALAYSFKWAWSPLVDSLKIPVLTKLLGRRRSWLLLAQVGVIAGLIGMAYSDPQTHIDILVWCTVVVAFFGATQDIALDAYRIESAEEDAQSALAACYLAGYRLAIFWVGAGLLKIVARAQSTPEGTYDYSAWQTGYLIMAASMLVGVLTVLLSKEPTRRREYGASLSQDVIQSSMLPKWLQNPVPVLMVVFSVVGAILFLLAFIDVSLLIIMLWNSPDIYLPLLTNQDFLLNFFSHPEKSSVEYFFMLVWYAVTFTFLVLAFIWLLGKRLPQDLENWINTSVSFPFYDFFKRYRWHALLILALISVYRISDIVMGVMTMPLYVELGYSKDAVANVTKIFGVVMTLVGAGLGGLLSMRLGVLFTLALGALLSAGSNLAFSWLSVVPLDHVVPLWTGTAQEWLSNIAGTDAQLKLVAVIAIDNLSQGVATAAFIAYLSSLTNVQFSATQYALFSSIMTLLPKTLAGFSGGVIERISEAISTDAWQWLPTLSLKFATAEQWGFSLFFMGTALIGLPVLLLVAIVALVPKLRGSKPSTAKTSTAKG